MPYIRQAFRKDYEKFIEEIPVRAMPGEITFMFYVILKKLSQDPVRGGLENFASGAQVLGCLEAAKLEFYRREMAPYEDNAIEENGDVKV